MMVGIAYQPSLLCRCVLAGALALAGQPTGAASDGRLQNGPGPAAATPGTKRMADNREWTTSNADVDIAGSYCYDDAPSNCRRYGRLYTWDAAPRACQAIGAGWKLPTEADWRLLAQHYGGAGGEDGRLGSVAYEALLTGGRSGFEAVLGGGRSGEGEYMRVDAHGLYWTATEVTANIAVFYNFGKGSRGLYRQNAGEKGRAFSVRCVRD
jgi:uncharacterized protein (TIGR02145 family)